MAARRPERRRSRRWPLRRRSRRPACTLTANCPAHQPKRRLAPRRLALLRPWGCRSRRSSLRRRSRHLACILTAPRAASQPGRRRTQPAILPTAPTNPRPAPPRHIPAAVRRHVWLRDGGRCCYRDPLTGRRLQPLPICCRPTTCCQSPKAAARTCSTYNYSALPIAACATATGRLCRRNASCSASSALLARRSTPLAAACRWTWPGGTPFVSPRAERASSPPHHQTLAVGLPSTNLPLPAIGTIANDPLFSTASAPSIMAVNPCIVLPASSLSHAGRGSICVCA